MAATFIRIFPAVREPVKPPALISGCFNIAIPISLPASNKSENTPSGRLHSRTACCTARPTSSLVPGCAGCAFTMTGFPAARAEAVSPPATENARGKLLAPKTTTGPSARKRERMSGFGAGLRSGSARSMRAIAHEPSSINCAKSRSWPHVRAVSPCRRAWGNAVSTPARSMISAAIASMFAAIWRRNFALL